MVSIVKVRSGTWKAVVSKRGWLTVAKMFRTKRDAGDWSLCTEDDRSPCIRPAPAAFVQLTDTTEQTIVVGMAGAVRTLAPGAPDGASIAPASKTPFDTSWRGHLVAPCIPLRTASGAGTRFVQSERFSGLLVGRLTRSILDDTLNEMKAMNSALKRRVEALPQ